VFKEVSGQRLDRIEYSDGLYYGYGEMLGKLHHLSQKYTPAIEHPDWKQRLQWTLDVLKEYAAPETALNELSILNSFFTTLPADPNNYGLVHYDFEPDNIFYDEKTSQYSVIDFDDAVVHWFSLDIEQALDSIKDELPEHKWEQAAKQFFSGYRSIKSTDEAILFFMPVFRRYVDLFGYARCLRSLHEKWDNEPDWMIGLRVHLERRMDARSKCFGKEIVLTK